MVFGIKSLEKHIETVSSLSRVLRVKQVLKKFAKLSEDLELNFKIEG